MRRLSQKEKVPFKRSRWLLLKNPWNLSDDQKERLSTLVRWNTPIVRAYYLKEAFQLFWDYQQPKRDPIALIAPGSRRQAGGFWGLRETHERLRDHAGF